MRIICDEHDVKMVYNSNLCQYECPVPECPKGLRDEDRFNLGNLQGKEVRVT